jgi:hypothetical protein
MRGRIFHKTNLNGLAFAGIEFQLIYICPLREVIKINLKIPILTRDTLFSKREVIYILPIVGMAILSSIVNDSLKNDRAKFSTLRNTCDEGNEIRNGLVIFNTLTCITQKIRYPWNSLD